MRKTLASGLLALFFPLCVTSAVGGAGEDGPFGLAEFVAPEREAWNDYRKVKADMQAELPKLDFCKKHPADCTVGEAELESILAEAEGQQGRAKIEVVNKKVNAAIHYTSDKEQWGVDDVWSAPVDIHGKGSFDTGKGDCEDYALAKYLVFRFLGVNPADMIMVIVHDNFVHEDHAVLVVHEDGRWLILDNRWDTLYEDKELMPRFRPLLAVNTEGVDLMVKSFTLGGSHQVRPSSGR